MNLRNPLILPFAKHNCVISPIPQATDNQSSRTFAVTKWEFIAFPGSLFQLEIFRERQPAGEGTQAGEVGEEEAGSQRRSPMWDSILERQDHALSQRQPPNDCATQAPLLNPFLHSSVTSFVPHCMHVTSGKVLFKN